MTANALTAARRIAAKETTLFFSATIGYVFLGSFAAVCLFVFFWVETFFARNIADIRPLFEWLPILLIFLCSALTMRQWSEEKRSGTLEHVLTQPLPSWAFVLGKFLACLGLLGIALLITLPLPITVAVLGNLDWGPVAAGYLAALLLGGTYLSIGLFISSRSDNQIVSMLVATAVCGALYLLGNAAITDFFGSEVSELLQSLGTGSRFESITRGVIDARDIAYYLVLCVVFLALNTYVLETERWAESGKPEHSRWQLGIALIVLNALALNLWLGQLPQARLDVSEGRQFSLSAATQSYLEQLQEPLLMRGYFSSKNHPLLAPLVPQLRDLLEEYAVAGNGKVRVDIIDPLTDPEREREANQKFGIQPVPFQVADRYQSAIVSAYFNIVIQYGDEFQVLGYNDLIDIKAQTETDVEVALRNPEYDLTRSIRNVIKSYQAAGNLFDTIQGDVAFVGYVSADEQLPEPLREYKALVQNALADARAEADERLLVTFADPLSGDGSLAQQIADDFGFKPMTTSLLSDERFYFYMTLQQDGVVVQIPLDDRSLESFERNLAAAIKRFASGFTKTVALAAPQLEPTMAQFGMAGPRYTLLENFLAGDLNVQREDLNDGGVAGDADILVLIAPDAMTDAEVFAVDQFLMRGGTVVVATAPFKASFENRSMNMAPASSGLGDWLAHHGIAIGEQLVMDPVNAAFPIPVARDVGGFQVQELRLLDYPYFPDLRTPGLNPEHPVTADLGQTTLAWAAPVSVSVDADKSWVALLESSPAAWLDSGTDVLPRLAEDGSSGFTPGTPSGPHVLGAAVSGRFTSYFAERELPEVAATQPTVSAITRSPDTARLIVYSSNDFLRDQVLQLLGAATGGDYQNSLQLMANTIDWSLEDAGLLSIRSRGFFNRTLPPLDRGAQLFWEYLNYGLAIALLALVAVAQSLRLRARQRRFADALRQAAAGTSS